MSDPDPLMPIGMFSRACLVSIKALRAYHDQGLLVPAEVNPSTGYRSYRVSQLTDAQTIKRLRDLDVPLRDVAEIMAARDPEITQKVMAEHETVMRQHLAEVTRIVDELQRAQASPASHTPVHRRNEPSTHVLAVTGVVEAHDYGPFLDSAYQRLFAAQGRVGAVPAGPTGALYPSQVDAGDEEVTAYLPVAEPVTLPDEVVATGVTMALLPAVTGAVMTHLGSYQTIGDTYRQLGAWVAHHAASADQPVRELYVTSIDPTTGQLLPPEELRTEIVWPIVIPTRETPPERTLS